MHQPEPILIEYQYKGESYLAWAKTFPTPPVTEYIVETLTPGRRDVVRMNHNAEWESNGKVTTLSMAIGKAIEDEG